MYKKLKILLKLKHTVITVYKLRRQQKIALGNDGLVWTGAAEELRCFSKSIPIFSVHINQLQAIRYYILPTNQFSNITCRDSIILQWSSEIQDTE